MRDMLKFVVLLFLAFMALGFEGKSIEEAKDTFFEKIRFEGEWRQAEVDKKLGSCEPCYFMIQMYSHKIVCTIQGNTKVFQYQVEFQQPDEGILFFREYDLVSTDFENKIEVNMAIQPQAGINYSFKIKLVDLGVYIEHEENRYPYLVLAITIIYSLLYLIAFPLSQQAMKENIQKMTQKTNPVILIIYSLNIILIVAYHLIIVTFYLLNYPGYIGKIFFYSLFGSAFLVSIIQFGYGFAAIQMNIESKVKEDSKCKLLILLSIGGLLIVSPLIVIFFAKNFWFHAFFVLSLIGQGLISLSKAQYPSWRFIFLFSLNIIYLALISDLYPVLNFRNLSIFELLTLLEIVVICVGGMYIVLRRKVKATQMIELRPQTENEIKWSKEEKDTKYSVMSEPEIKSDIELK